MNDVHTLTFPNNNKLLITIPNKNGSSTAISMIGFPMLGEFKYRKARNPIMNKFNWKERQYKKISKDEWELYPVRVAILRDPIKRFISCYNDRVVNKNKNNSRDYIKDFDFFINNIVEIQKKFRDIKFNYVIQEEQKGLGHAILLAKEYIKDEPFAILLPDDLFFSEKSCLAQLAEAYKKTNSSVIAVNKIDSENIHKYGVIDPGKIHDNFIEIKGIIEKPNLADAPSDIAVCGRYILNSSIFNYLEETIEDLSNEIQLTDAIKLMLNNEKVSACVYEGEKFDCGSKQGFVEATIAISLRDEEIKDDITKYIKQLST